MIFEVLVGCPNPILTPDIVLYQQKNQYWIILACIQNYQYMHLSTPPLQYSMQSPPGYNNSVC